MVDIKQLKDHLVTANRILAKEGVMDAFGHVSVRHPSAANRYIMSQARAPELITGDDLMEFLLDGEPIDAGGRTPYKERMIHGAIYELRPDVNSVVHNHSYEVLPYGSTGTPLRPIAHTCAVIGSDIPVWDIRDKFGEGNHLVVTMDQGRGLARALGGRSAALMKRHGCVIAGRNLKEAVMMAIYLQVNARVQRHAMQLGTPDYLTEAEIAACTAMQFSPIALERAWDYWCVRAGGS